MIPSGRSKTAGSLYVFVLTGIALGVALGWVAPAYAIAMKPLGDGFIKLIKMLIGPVVFTTVVVGIARMGAMKDVGRIGLRALVYFEVVSTGALLIGLAVGNLLQPGAGLNVDPSTLDPSAVASYGAQAQKLTTVDFILNVIPTTVLDAFARGDLLQILLFSVLFGLALLTIGKPAAPLVELLASFSQALFGMISMIMWLAPLGAFGAMAFTVGQYGLGALLSLGKLMAGVYITCATFIVFILGAILRASGISLWRFLRYIREEILIVLGTSSSESALPPLMQKLEYLGCRKPIVGLVIPTGYSFNLDGTSIYMTMATLFVAQATNVHLGIREQLSVLGVLLLTSKGAAGVTGSGFITLAATLSAIHTVPVAGLALLLGVDRFMSEVRAITNLIGNGVATVAIARWDGGFDLERARHVLNGEPVDAGATVVMPVAARESEM
jgi:aerobic C4-dicarboxylate transport protein